MPTDITPEARRLFAVVVNELWHDHPELVVPGWINWEWDGDDLWLKQSHMTSTKVMDVDILAAAALCAKAGEKNPDSVLRGRDAYGRFYVDVPKNLFYVDSWESAQFAATLAEKGIEHE